MPLKLAIINGPNLNMLGQREKEKYGDQTLADLEKYLREKSALMAKLSNQGAPDLSFFQSNHEGQLIDHIHTLAKAGFDAIVINAASCTHTSIGLRDALLSVNLPFVEVHISNVYAREEFRHRSYLADQARGVITGLGFTGYLSAVCYFMENLP